MDRRRAGTGLCPVDQRASARLAGIRTRTTIFIGFGFSGLAVVVGGLILVSQLGAASPNAAK